MGEVEIVKDIVNHALQQNAVLTIGAVVIIIVVSKLLEYFSKKNAQTADKNRDIILNKMVDTLNSISEAQNKVIGFISEMQTNHISNTKERMKKIIELILKKMEKDIFAYTRQIILDDIYKNKFDDCIQTFTDSQYKKVIVTLNMFEFNGKNLGDSLAYNIVEEVTTCIICNNIVEDKSAVLNIVNSNLKRIFDDYINLLITKL